MVTRLVFIYLIVSPLLWWLKIFRVGNIMCFLDTNHSIYIVSTLKGGDLWFTWLSVEGCNGKQICVGSPTIFQAKCQIFHLPFLTKSSWNSYKIFLFCFGSEKVKWPFKKIISRQWVVGARFKLKSDSSTVYFTALSYICLKVISVWFSHMCCQWSWVIRMDSFSSATACLFTLLGYCFYKRNLHSWTYTIQ